MMWLFKFALNWAFWLCRFGCLGGFVRTVRAALLDWNCELDGCDDFVGDLRLGWNSVLVVTLLVACGGCFVNGFGVRVYTKCLLCYLFGCWFECSLVWIWFSLPVCLTWVYCWMYCCLLYVLVLRVLVCCSQFVVCGLLLIAVLFAVFFCVVVWYSY